MLYRPPAAPLGPPTHPLPHESPPGKRGLPGAAHRLQRRPRLGGRSRVERRPVGLFRANLAFVDDRRYDGLTIERLPQFVPESSGPTFIFLVDRETLTRTDHPILVVDLFDQRGRSFRVIPSEMWSVENNLSLANMDWEDFAGNVDADGVFRGFPR